MLTYKMNSKVVLLANVLAAKSSSKDSNPADATNSCANLARGV